MIPLFAMMGCQYKPNESETKQFRKCLFNVEHIPIDYQDDQRDKPCQDNAYVDGRRCQDLEDGEPQSSQDDADIDSQVMPFE
jgi:hypothetical protein